jgi:ATP-dependent Clp protease ATP-binding subunit ClpA
LRRAIQRYVEDPIANLLIRSGSSNTQNIEVDTQDDKLIFSPS